jgi:hypothetical protein
MNVWSDTGKKNMTHLWDSHGKEWHTHSLLCKFEIGFCYVAQVGLDSRSSCLSLLSAEITGMGWFKQIMTINTFKWNCVSENNKHYHLLSIIIMSIIYSFQHSYPSTKGLWVDFCLWIMKSKLYIYMCIYVYIYIYINIFFSLRQGLAM